MRATEFLIERISSRVFHYTRVTTALKILQSGQFELSHTLGTSWEAQFAPKGYPYFLSTTRTRHGGYHGYLGQDAVLFELDGDFYNQRYPGKAVDYWNNRDPMRDHHKAHEAEDRIFSRGNAIPAAIKVIDLYIAPDADDAVRARTRQVIILAKKAGIPVNLFNDQAAWRQRDTRRLADVSQLRGQDPARGYVERRRGGYLKPWMELMQAKTKAQLSKAADSKRYDLQYTYDKQGLAKSLAVDLSNARKPGPDADRNNAIRIIKFMQQNRLSTVDDFVNFLADKWKNIKEGVAEGIEQQYQANKIFFARSKLSPKNWSYDHVGFITQDGKQIQMSGHKGDEVYITNRVTDDPEFPEQNIKIVSLSKTVLVPATNTVGAENCGSFVSKVLQANGIKGITTDKLYAVFKKPLQQDVAEGTGFDQEAGIGLDGESFKFKIKDLVALANNYPVTPIDPRQFTQQIKGRNEDPTQSMARAEKADLQYPIIVVQRTNGKLWIADGTHRAHKAILNKIPKINAKIIPIKDMSSFSVKQGVAEASDLQEIEAIPAQSFAGGKDILDTQRLPAKRNLKPLPGGTDLLYAVEQNRYVQRVSIVEPGMPGITKPHVVAVLNLDTVTYLPNTVQVQTITVDEHYRGRGLAKALYGIVFTVMRKNLLSGASQTPGGRRNWMSLANIPGVEVKGLVRILDRVFDIEPHGDRIIDQIMALGGQFFTKNDRNTYWLFDVVPGKGSLQPAVRNSLSKLYDKDSDTLLLATWSGNQPGVAEGVMSDLDEDRNPVYQLPELTLILDPHFIERMGTRQLNSRVVAQLMSRLKNLTQELSQFEPGQKIWINSPSLKVKLGMRRQMDRNGKMTYLLKTVVKDPTWDNPDPTVTTENFADGRKPGRKGLSKRVGIPKKATLAQLEKIANSSTGERRRMAQWQLNMRRGKQK